MTSVTVNMYKRCEEPKVELKQWWFGILGPVTTHMGKRWTYVALVLHIKILMERPKCGISVTSAAYLESRDWAFYKTTLDFHFQRRHYQNRGFFRRFTDFLFTGDRGPHFICHRSIYFESTLPSRYGVRARRVHTVQNIRITKMMAYLDPWTKRSIILKLKG